MAKEQKKKTKKKGALALAASRKLASIGGPSMSPEDLAHALLHAEERGEAERVPLEDGSWAWSVTDGTGEAKLLKPTPAMLAALERFARDGHPAH